MCGKSYDEKEVARRSGKIVVDYHCCSQKCYDKRIYWKKKMEKKIVRFEKEASPYEDKTHAVLVTENGFQFNQVFRGQKDDARTIAEAYRFIGYRMIKKGVR